VNWNITCSLLVILRCCVQVIMTGFVQEFLR